MIFLFIRHGQTESNASRCYLGQKDEPLDATGRLQAEELARRGLPTPGRIFCSPLKRCLETAEKAFPGCVPEVIPEFREIDFGRFEGKNHDELMASEPCYQQWLDSGGTADIPEGENMEILTERVKLGWAKLLKTLSGQEKCVAVVVHGGTVMALFALLCDPPRAYYDSYIKNCGAVLCDYRDGHLHILGGDVK